MAAPNPGARPRAARQPAASAAMHPAPSSSSSSRAGPGRARPRPRGPAAGRPARSSAAAAAPAEYDRALKTWSESMDEESGETLLAAVDMGTNSFHMVVVKADELGRFKIIDAMKEEVRLLQGGGKFNIISPEAEERALGALKRLGKVAEKRGAPVRIVATSATREASNSDAFLRNIEEQVGIPVEVISGQEEATLTYLGIMSCLAVKEKTLVMVDIGGGSTEVLVGSKGIPLLATSLRLGHLRQYEQFFDDTGTVTEEQVSECRRYIRSVLADAGVKEEIEVLLKQGYTFDLAVGSSGTIETIGDMIAANPEFDDPYEGGGEGPDGEPNGERLLPPEDGLVDFKEKVIPADSLTVLARAVAELPREERAKLPGLTERRLNLIVSGAIILDEIFELLKIPEMKVSTYALREGLIVDSLSMVIPGYVVVDDIQRESVRQLAQRFDTENRMDSCEHSARLAMQIVDGLCGPDSCVEAARAIDERARGLLEAGIMLHYAGMAVSHKGYHKHGYYIITNTESLLGFTPLEVEIIALLVRYQRKKAPSRKNAEIAKLPRESRNLVRVLVSVARIAVALDRLNTANSVKRVEVLQDGTDCAILVVPNEVDGRLADVSVEIWAAREETKFFGKVFDMNLEIVESSEARIASLDSVVSS